jgi:ParB/RepB/Spo0J family partition protein
VPSKFEGVEVGRADILKFPPEELGSIVLSLNLREDLGDLTEFKKGLAAQGQLQPGLVRRDAQGRPVLVAGYRRLTSIREINDDPGAWGLAGPMPFLAKLVTVNEDEALVINLRENLDRKELSPIDLAYAARRLALLEWDRQKIADAMRLLPSRVGQILSLLELPSRLRKLIHRGKVPESLARNLRGLPEHDVDELVQLVEEGQRPGDVLRRAKDEQRARGRKTARSLADLRSALQNLHGEAAFNLLQWIDGDPTVSLAEVFPQPRKGAA